MFFLRGGAAEVHKRQKGGSKVSARSERKGGSRIKGSGRRGGGSQLKIMSAHTHFFDKVRRSIIRTLFWGTNK